MGKLKNCFSATVGKGDEIKTFLAAYNSAGSEELLQSTSGALNVHLESSDINFSANVDLDGVYNGTTNTDPDNIGAIFHARATTPGDSDQTFRSTGSASYSSVASASLSDVHALDVNAFALGKDGSGNAVPLALDASGNIQADLVGVALNDDSLKVSDTYSGIATAQGTIAASGTPTATQIASATNQGRVRIQNTSDDDDNIFYIGGSSVSSSNGYNLYPGAEIELEYSGDLYVIPEDNEAVSYSVLQLSV